MHTHTRTHTRSSFVHRRDGIRALALLRFLQANDIEVKPLVKENTLRALASMNDFDQALKLLSQFR